MRKLGSSATKQVPIVLLSLPPLPKYQEHAIICSRKVRAALTFYGSWKEPPDSLRTALLLFPCGRVQI